jgi:hypothetical protein
VVDGLGQVLASHEENSEAERRRRNLREVVSVSERVSVRMHVQTQKLEAVYMPAASRFSHAPSDAHDVPRLGPVPAGSAGKLARVGHLHVRHAPHANRVSLKRISSLDVSSQVSFPGSYRMLLRKPPKSHMELDVKCLRFVWVAKALMQVRRPTASKLEKAQHSVLEVPLALSIRSSAIVGRANLLKDGLPLVAKRPTNSLLGISPSSLAGARPTDATHPTPRPPRLRRCTVRPSPMMRRRQVNGQLAICCPLPHLDADLGNAWHAGRTAKPDTAYGCEPAWRVDEVGS